MLVWAIMQLATLTGAAPAGGPAALMLSGAGPTDLFLTAPPDAIVREQRELPLRRGLNSVVFTWEHANLDRNTVRLRPLDGKTAVDVVARVLPSDRTDRVLFEIDSEADATVPFLVTYALRNVAWRLEYVATLTPGSDTFDLEAFAVVSNASGQILRDVRLVLGIAQGEPEGLELAEGPVQIGESIRVPYRRWEGLPVRREYVIDDARYANRAAAHLVLENTAAAGLGKEHLIPGRLRVFSAQPGGMPTLLAEDQLPATPIGEESEILIGFVDELTIERRQLWAKRINERKDTKGALVVYDLDQEMELKIESRFAESVEVTIVEHVDGYWILRDTKLATERPDAFTLRLRATIAPQDITRARWRLEHRNQAP